MNADPNKDLISLCLIKEDNSKCRFVFLIWTFQQQQILNIFNKNKTSIRFRRLKKCTYSVIGLNNSIIQIRKNISIMKKEKKLRCN